MTAAIVCVGVFAGSLLLAWRLGRFLRECDRRHAAMVYTVTDMRRSTQVVEEAEAIVRNAYSTDPTTWP